MPGNMAQSSSRPRDSWPNQRDLFSARRTSPSWPPDNRQRRSGDSPLAGGRHDDAHQQRPRRRGEAERHMRGAEVEQRERSRGDLVAGH